MTDTQTALEADLDFLSELVPEDVPDETWERAESALERIRAALQSRTEQDPVICKNCGGTNLSWSATNTHGGGISQGRLNTSDVQCLFVLGCEECSETVAVKRADIIAKEMNSEASSGVNQKPELYQYRHYTHTGKPYWANERILNGSTSNETRPLYASPPDQSARIAELEAEKREMLDALEPFALYSKSYDPDEGDSDQMAWDAGNTITIGQLRKAAALHNKLKEK